MTLQRQVPVFARSTLLVGLNPSYRRGLGWHTALLRKGWSRPTAERFAIDSFPTQPTILQLVRLSGAPAMRHRGVWQQPRWASAAPTILKKTFKAVVMCAVFLSNAGRRNSLVMCIVFMRISPKILDGDAWHCYPVGKLCTTLLRRQSPTAAEAYFDASKYKRYSRSVPNGIHFDGLPLLRGTCSLGSIRNDAKISAAGAAHRFSNIFYS